MTDTKIGIDLDNWLADHDQEAEPCLRKSCKAEGTYRIDCLVDGHSTRITVFACEEHYFRALYRWNCGWTEPPILHAWFRGRK